jgi:hypothetical protein
MLRQGFVMVCSAWASEIACMHGSEMRCSSVAAVAAVAACG